MEAFGRPIRPNSGTSQDIFAPYDRYFRSGNKVNIEFTDQLAHEIIASKPFQRLGDISFLGAISYARHFREQNGPIKESRFEHSVGVARLAERFASKVGLLPSERREVVAAALLHDIGHPPLSHSAEDAFKARLGVDHHDLTLEIITGNTEFGRPIPRILNSHSVSVDSVIALLEGSKSYANYKLFSGPFNLDTLEGISRCSAYRLSRVSYTIPAPDLVLSAAINPDPTDAPPILDCFWRMKGQIYNEFIRSETGVLADYIASSYFADNRRKISRRTLIQTESELMQEHKKLFENLYQFTGLPELHGKTITYFRRNFIIDRGVSVNALEKRYRQTKTQKSLHVDKI